MLRPRRTSAPLAPRPRLDRIEILFICTGNICRSPAAEALLRHRLEQSGVAAHVHSAGLLEGGNPAHAHGVDVLSQRGLDVSAHRSRAMTADLVRGADLVLGMAKEHVVQAATIEKSTWPKTFTLKEFVRRAETVGPRRPHQPFEEWLGEVHGDRKPSDVMSARDIDVEDPIGKPRAAYERMVAELDGLVRELVWLVWGEAGDARAEAAERAS